MVNKILKIVLILIMIVSFSFTIATFFSIDLKSTSFSEGKRGTYNDQGKCVAGPLNECDIETDQSY